MEEVNIFENEDMSQVFEKKWIENLVLSGGSIRGISHVGVLYKLIKENVIQLSKLKKICGVSAGALLGCLITLGFDIRHIWEFLINLDMKKLIKPDLMCFLQKCGAESGKIIYKLMSKILEEKTNIKNITFKQLYDKYPIEYTVVGTCLTTKSTIYYNYLNTPDFNVALAIRISIGMPGLFIPIELDKKKYIDGAVLNNYPMELFKDELNKTIGILICNDYNTEYTCVEEYFTAVINLFLYKYYHETAAKYTNTICVNEQSQNISVFNFDLDQNTKKKLFKSGINAAEEFIKKNK